MEGLIDGILHYSRAGRVHETPAPVSVGALVREVVDLLAAADATISIATDLPEVLTDRTALQQVFQNLIGNALKHAGPRARIAVSAADAGDEFWRFAVSDDGPGIAEEFHERVWGMFQTLQPRDAVEGAGIGLSLVRKLVEGQGGTVTLKSSPGAGATFAFTWRKQAAEAE
jgi:signal transduction histidine kinase